jgi:CubicO group peptidase (beta-lactamase class C family)
MRTAAICSLLTLAGAASAHAQLVAYDFSTVDALCQQALAGVGLTDPVPGFDLLIMKDGEVVFHRAYGQWFTGRVANSDSTTKTLSGALIMSLTERSALPFSLDTRIGQYVPTFVGAKQNITVRQCFSHQAGFDSSLQEGNPNVTLQQAGANIGLLPLLYTPGTAFSYGGTSMHAAGAAAEAAGGQSWNALFAERITGPLGMVRTQFVLTTPTNPRIGGGCESTAPEFARFMEMLRRGGVHRTPAGDVRVLSQASVDEMFTRQTAVGIPVLNSPLQRDGDVRADYGVGVWLDDRDASGQLLGAIAAGARGFSSWVDFDDGVVGVVCTDLTLSANTQGWVNRVRDAVELVVRNPRPCLADTAAPGQAQGPDGQLTADDIIVFINWFFAADVRADIAGPGQTPGPDGEFTADDLIRFVNAFFAGCV